MNKNSKDKNRNQKIQLFTSITESDSIHNLEPKYKNYIFAKNYLDKLLEKEHNINKKENKLNINGNICNNSKKNFENKFYKKVNLVKINIDDLYESTNRNSPKIEDMKKKRIFEMKNLINNQGIKKNKITDKKENKKKEENFQNNNNEIKIGKVFNRISLNLLDLKSSNTKENTYKCNNNDENPEDITDYININEQYYSNNYNNSNGKITNEPIEEVEEGKEESEQIQSSEFHPNIISNSKNNQNKNKALLIKDIKIQKNKLSKNSVTQKSEEKHAILNRCKTIKNKENSYKNRKLILKDKKIKKNTQKNNLNYIEFKLSNDNIKDSQIYLKTDYAINNNNSIKKNNYLGIIKLDDRKKIKLKPNKSNKSNKSDKPNKKNYKDINCFITINDKKDNDIYKSNNKIKYIKINKTLKNNTNNIFDTKNTSKAVTNLKEIYFNKKRDDKNDKIYYRKKIVKKYSNDNKDKIIKNISYNKNLVIKSNIITQNSIKNDFSNRFQINNKFYKIFNSQKHLKTLNKSNDKIFVPINIYYKTFNEDDININKLK